MRIQETRKERTEGTADIWECGRGASMEKPSLLREVLSLSSQWDPSSSNGREYLYIAVIMGCNDFVNGGNKERNGSLVPRCHLPFSLGSFCSSVFFHRWRRGGSKTSEQPNTVLGNRRLRLSAGSTSFCTDPQLMGKTTSYSLMATPDSKSANAASRPPALFLLTYRFIFCRVEAFTLFSFLSLCSTTPPFLVLSLPASLSRSLFSSQDPSHCWMAALPVSVLTWVLEIWAPPPSILLSFSNLLRPTCRLKPGECHRLLIASQIK